VLHYFHNVEGVV